MGKLSAKNISYNCTTQNPFFRMVDSVLLYIVSQGSQCYNVDPHNMSLASLSALVFVTHSDLWTLNWVTVAAESLLNVLFMKWLAFWLLVMLLFWAVNTDVCCVLRAVCCFFWFCVFFPPDVREKHLQPFATYASDKSPFCLSLVSPPARGSLCDLPAPLGAKLWAPRCRSRWAGFYNLHNYARCVQ